MPEIQYYFDPYCGWCYGFSPVIRRLEETYRDRFDFEIVSGGMVTGERAGPIGPMANYILQAIPQVEKTTGIKFGEPYVELLKEGKYSADSLVPSKAVTVMKAMAPDRVFTFGAELQKAFYYQARDLNDLEVLADLASDQGVEKEDFKTRFADPKTQHETISEFERTAEMGIGGFPSLILNHQDQYYRLAHGYTSYENLVQVMDQVQEMTAVK